MSIRIHAWLARDIRPKGPTHLFLSQPTKHWNGEVFYWTSLLGPTPLVKGHHGLRPGQIKAVVITEDIA